MLVDMYKYPTEDPTRPEQSYLSFIENLSLIDHVEVFGLHSNANLGFLKNEMNVYLNALQALEPAATVGSIKSNEQEVCLLLFGVL